MFRLFISLWIVVTLALLILLLPFAYNPVNLISEKLVEKRISNTFGGIFKILEDKLGQHPVEAWPDKIKLYQTSFAYGLDLIALDDTRFSPGLQKKLSQDRIHVVNTDDDSYLEKRLLDSNWVLHLPLEETETQRTINLASGISQMLRTALINTQPVNYPDILQYYQQRLGFPISVTAVEQLTLDDKRREALQEKQQTWQETAEYETLVYYLLPNGKVLTIGPVPFPGNLNVIIFLLFGFFIFVVSLSLFLFVVPLWRDLNRMRNTAKRLGSGELDARVQLKKRSSILPIAQSFNAMADQVANMVQRNRELGNAIAHDLRSPLARMSFALNMLEDNSVPETQKQKYRQVMQRSVDLMDHLIQQILTLSRYQRAIDSSHFEYCKLTALIQQEVAIINTTEVKIKVEVEIDDKLTNCDFWIDRLAMQRLLNNLLDNAQRYANSWILVKLVGHEQGYSLWVDDDGSGVPESEREKIFTAFFQGDHSRPLTGSSGLGLAIVAEIAHWHQGHAFAELSPQGGARIGIRCPILSHSATD